MNDIIECMIPFMKGNDSLENCLDKAVEKINELCEEEIKERMKNE